jgi:hypothetical protein
MERLMQNTPLGPSGEDIAQMRKIRSLMENLDLNTLDIPIDTDDIPVRDSNSDRQVAPPPSGYSSPASNADVGAMKKILESFYSGIGEVEKNTTSELVVQSPSPLQKKPMEQNFSQKWAVRKNIHESKQNKSTTFSIHSGNNVLEQRFNVVESAKSVCHLLNNGYNIDSSKVQKIIDLDEEFAVLRLETAKLKRLYERSTQLNETQAADVFAQKHQTSKANALCIKTRIESIWEILE